MTLEFETTNDEQMTVQEARARASRSMSYQHEVLPEGDGLDGWVVEEETKQSDGAEHTPQVVSGDRSLNDETKQPESVRNAARVPQVTKFEPTIKEDECCTACIVC